jgi:hypothetical protein
MVNLSDKSVQCVLVVVALVVVGYLLMNYFNNQNVEVSYNDNMEEFSDVMPPTDTAEYNQMPEYDGEVEASEPLGQNSTPKGLGQMESTQMHQLPAECYPKDVLTSADLLPHDANSKWAQAAPSGQGSLMDKNFLSAGFHVGINTVGQTLRNANYQLRSDPIIEKRVVSPWMNTTIEADTNRRPLEIGM